MKKIIESLVLTAAACGAFFFVAGCKSTPVVLADHSPAAIMSVSANSALPWTEMKNSNNVAESDGTGVLTDMVNKVINGENPEVYTSQDRLDYAAQTLHELLGTTGGIEVLDHEKLEESKNYQAIITNPLNLIVASKSATGYKLISGVGAKRARLLMQETGAKSLVFAEFDFRKKNSAGNNWTGKVCAQVKMKIKIIDETGKEILNNEYIATSAEELPIKSRKYDRQALVNLFPATIDAVINQFIVSLIQ